jgi:four helix bundle protein
MKPEVHNLAEGFESQTKALFIELLGRAKGSAGELRAQLYLALDRSYILPEEFNQARTQAESCSKQITRLIQYLESKPNARRVQDSGAFYDV